LHSRDHVSFRAHHLIDEQGNVTQKNPPTVAARAETRTCEAHARSGEK